jgi:uncharacterized protein (DUF2141 family)
MQKLIIILTLSFISLFGLQAQETNRNIVVNVTNISSNEGKIIIGLYDNEADFLKNPLKGKYVEIKNNTCSVTFENIPEGTYAISFFHDENDNGKMDTNFMRIPKEDYGCSNNARGFMGPPKWKDAKFELKDKTITQHIEL